MAAILFPRGGTLTAEHRKSLYAGDLVVLRDVPAVRTFATAAATFIQRFLGPGDPCLAADDAALTELPRVFREDADMLDAARGMLTKLLPDAADSAWDHPFLRVQRHQSPGDRGTLPVHRDTWGSRIPAQINWWTPIFPITAGRTIAMYPGYFERAIANDSETWRPRGHSYDGPPARQVAPVAGEEPDEAPLPIVIEPGDVLCFSGQHLHASVPNRTARIRFSLEVRTCLLADVATGNGPVPVDWSGKPRVQWFSRLSDDLPVVS